LPYSWPLKKARPTREAVMPVPTMTVSGSILFCVFNLRRFALCPARRCRMTLKGQSVRE
jgi:hypothetical protein